jgi:hypothetical protein
MKRSWWWAVGLAIALLFVFVLAPLASDNPDGLEKVAEDKGFAESAKEPRYEWLPDYTIPGVESEYWSTVLSGAIGVGIVFILVVGLAAGMKYSRRTRGQGEPGPLPSPE